MEAIAAKWNRWVLGLRIKQSKVMLLLSRRVSDKLIQAAAAKCLKPRDAKTSLVLDWHNNCLADERRVRTGS